MIRNFLINYFGFNRQQRNGLLILMAGVVMLFIIRLAMPHFIGPGNIELKNLPLVQVDDSSSSHENRENFVHHTEHSLFKFDPNTVNQEQLIQLGFSEKQAASFIRFRGKGFVFHKKEDLKKVFVVSDKLYEKLTPYVFIVENPKSDLQPALKNAPVEAAKHSAQVIELNSADSLTLLTLPGVGPAYAKRILKYRSLLGGFTAVEQLKEVYGFSEESYDNVKDKVSVDGTGVKKIDLNSDDFKIITRHPYIGFERTKSIFAFRKKQPITSANLGELFSNESERNRLLPYLNLAQ